MLSFYMRLTSGEMEMGLGPGNAGEKGFDGVDG